MRTGGPEKVAHLASQEGKPALDADFSVIKKRQNRIKELRVEIVRCFWGGKDC